MYNEYKDGGHMENYKVLPADTYVVVNKSILIQEDKKILNLLYLPIIGPTPIMLYNILWSDLEKGEIISSELTHHHLVTNMHMSTSEFLIARRKLEAIGLLKSYIKEGNVNNYIYELYSPISANEFFNHPILNIVLYNNIGKKEYEKLVNYFKIPKLNTTSYKNITASFNDVFASVPLTSYEVVNDNIRKTNKLKLRINTNFDFDFLVSSIPKNLISEKAFTKDIEELILNLSFIYDIDALKMVNIIKTCINEKGLINKEELRKNCRNYYQFDNGGLLPSVVDNTQPEFLRKPLGDNSKRAKIIYDFETISPRCLLKSRNNQMEPTKRDLKLIEDLIVEYGLKPGVVNVLIDYTLKVNNKKLNRNLIETIAGQWQRLKIETVDEAMQACEKEHKKWKKVSSYKKESSTTNTKLPEWFDKEIVKKEATEEEQDQLKELLKEYK